MLPNLELRGKDQVYILIITVAISLFCLGIMFFPRDWLPALGDIVIPDSVLILVFVSSGLIILMALVFLTAYLFPRVRVSE